MQGLAGALSNIENAWHCQISEDMKLDLHQILMLCSATNTTQVRNLRISIW